MESIGFYEKQHRYDDSYTEIVVYHTQRPNLKAAFAMQIVERWGMVAGHDGGEDSAGRAKIKLSPPKAIVDRACETAELLFQEFEKRGWILELPAPKKIVKEKSLA